MRYLIKLLSRALGRKIQSGSTLGAFVGMVFGLAAGAGLARLLTVGNLIAPDFSVSIYLITCIPLALIAALVGAAIGPRKPPIDARKGVRLTNYNRAAGILFIFFIFLAVIIFATVAPDKKNSSHQPSDDTSPTEYRAMEIAIGMLALISGFVAVREIWYIEVGSHIRVRRLLGSRFYTRHDVTMWGFEIRPNEVIQRSFEGKTNFCIQFTDGQLTKIEVDGRDSNAIIEALGLGPVSAAPKQ